MIVFNQNKKKKFCKNFLFIFAGMVVLILQIFSGCKFNEFYWRPSLLEHDIKNISPEFQSLWLKSDTFSIADDFETYLAVANQQIVFIGSFDSEQSPSVFNLDIETGELRWQINIFPTGFAYDSQSIYIGVSGGKILAYEIASGNKRWETNLNDARNFIYLIMQENKIQILSSTDNYYSIDSETGVIENTIKDTNTFFMDETHSFYQLSGPALTANYNESGTIAWQALLDDPFSSKPVFTENHIFLRTLEGAGPAGQVYVLDRQRGTVLWETPQPSVISNIAINENFAFYLTANAKLQAVDMSTGQLIASIEFEPEISQTDLVNRRFSVAVSDENLVVYLGDSQQLFAFRFLPDD